MADWPETRRRCSRCGMEDHTIEDCHAWCSHHPHDPCTPRKVPAMPRDMLGKAELPTPDHPMGVTVDGVPITPGLAVWTNEYRAGEVADTVRHDPEWFDVRYATGGVVMQNGERVATVFEGRSAADALAAERSAL